MLKCQLNFAKIFGFRKNVPKKLQTIFKILNTGSFILLIHTIVSCLVFIVRNYSNFLTVTEAIAGIITNTLALTKLLFLWKFSNDIFEFIDDLRRLNQKCE